MITRPNSAALPADYATRLVSTFRLIDDLLDRCVHCLDPTSLASPFSPHTADVTTARHDIVSDHAERLRYAMSAMLEHHNVVVPRPAASATRSGRALIDEALIAAAGLDPRNNPDFSRLDQEQKEDACRIVNQVMDLLAVLAEDLTTELATGLHHPYVQQEVYEPLARRLVDMKRVTESHGLARQGLSIDAMLDRLKSRDITIGVFGKVGAGKSSLLNCLLGSSLLPVSAIPATVTPVCITYGLTERGRVEFSDAISENFERPRLAEFVDAHFNAGNRRHVTRIEFRIPAPALHAGITLIDVPATTGGTDTMPFSSEALMLRCDLAVVLVSAVAPLALEEVKLIDELRHKGTDAMVLVTKADLLVPEERWRLYGHVVRELWQKARFEVPIYLISTRKSDTALCRAWQDGPLTEYLAHYRERQHTALQGKVNRLQDQLIEILQRQSTRVSRRGPSADKLAQVSAILSETRARLEATLTQPCEEPQSRARLDSLVDEVAHNAAVLWVEDRDDTFDVTRIIELSVIALARNVATRASWQIEQLRAQAGVALVSAANVLELPGSEFGYLPMPGDPPAFTPEGCLPSIRIPSGLGTLLGRWGFYLSARRMLRRSDAISVVGSCLNNHFVLLNAWKRSSLKILLEAYAMEQTRLCAWVTETNRRADSASTDAWTEQLLNDIALLREHTEHTGRQT